MRLEKAAGATDAGVQRLVNEDRFHVDAVRGLYMVVDGIGGQAAGGKAADLALSMLRKRLERETGAVDNRVREAIALANNEISRVAALRPEWRGMACVLTVVVIQGDRAIVGHVGDSRLYKLRNDRIEKITRDHSPVGEREDAREISESEAMRHPRRNEVYRDVGSEPHEPDDPEFIDVEEIQFEADAALLLCSDGLSDLVTSTSIAQIVRQFAGDAHQVARALVQTANDAGGKDNVTVVYIEGEQFAGASAKMHTDVARQFSSEPLSRPIARTFALVVLSIAIGLVLGWTRGDAPFRGGPEAAATFGSDEEQVVTPTESIMAAIARARPGSDVIVEPGEYREQLVLKDHVRVISRVARGVVLRLPVTASETESAIVASGLSRAELSGFRIVGDAATPLGTAILVRDSALAIVDVEITGATRAAVDVGGARETTLVASEIHDNAGAAMIVRAGSSPRITQNSFLHNGGSEHAAGSFVIEAGASPQLHRNLFHGSSPESFEGLDEASERTLTRDNWFVDSRKPNAPSKSPERRQVR